MTMLCVEATSASNPYIERRKRYERANGPTFKPLRNTCGNARCVLPAHQRISSRKELGQIAADTRWHHWPEHARD